jgi:hypothetical protein
LALVTARTTLSPGPFLPPENPANRQPYDQIVARIFSIFQANRDNAPPAELYLGLRSARRTLADHPDRFRAQFFLADFWLALQRQTRERGCANVLPFLDDIRHVQMAGALEGMLEQDLPDRLAQTVHLRLFGEIYREEIYLEAQVRHRKEFLRLCQVLENVPIAPEGMPFNKAIDSLEKETKQFVREVANRLNDYENKAARQPILEKARIALQLGLCETAVGLLTSKETSVKELVDPRNPQEAPGAFLALSLLLNLGRLKEAREVLTVEDHDKFRQLYGMHPLRVPAWDWFQVQLAAASGDYEEADRSLQEILTQVQKGTEAPLSESELGIVPAGEEMKHPGSLLEFEGLTLEDAVSRDAIRALSQVMLRRAGTNQQEADLHAVRAWLALEAGNIPRVQEELAQFRRVTALGLTARSSPLAELLEARLASATKPE